VQQHPDADTRCPSQEEDLFSANAVVCLVALMTGLELRPRRITVLGGLSNAYGSLFSTLKAPTQDVTEAQRVDELVAQLDKLYNLGFEVVAVPSDAYDRASNRLKQDQANWGAMRVERVVDINDVLLRAFKN
jgi:hypothetical protein